MQKAIITGDVYLWNAELAYVDALVEGRHVTLTFAGKKADVVPTLVKNNDVLLFDGYWAHNTYYVRSARPQPDSFIGRHAHQLLSNKVMAKGSIVNVIA